MSDNTSAERTLFDSFLRLVVIFVGAVLVAWLALRVIAGIVHFVAWLVTTAVIAALVIAAAYFLFGSRGRGSE